MKTFLQNTILSRHKSTCPNSLLVTLKLLWFCPGTFSSVAGWASWQPAPAPRRLDTEHRVADGGDDEVSPGHAAAGDGHGGHQGEAEAAAAPGHQERQQEDLQQPPAQVRYLLIYC